MSSAPRQGSRERGREREPREERSEREQERARARRRRRIAIAQRLGFPTVRAFARWRDEIALDHFAAFLCDYLSRGYTVVPGCGKDFVGFVDLERAVERRLAMLEARRFEVALDPDKSECEFAALFPPPFVLRRLPCRSSKLGRKWCDGRLPMNEG